MSKSMWSKWIEQLKGNPKNNKTIEEPPEQHNYITSILEENIKEFNELFHRELNEDFICRRFFSSTINKEVAIFFMKSIVDSKEIENYLIKPLQRNFVENQEYIDVISSQKVSSCKEKEEIISKICTGNAVLFVDGYYEAFVTDVANFQSISIGKAENEVTIKGPKEAFNEKLSTNISLIRKRIKNKDLVTENITISKRSNNEVVMIYNAELVNDQLLENVRKRLKALNKDSIQNLALLEQLIEERRYSIFSTVLYTERPDRAASFIEDGYIVLVMDSSPASLVVPATFWSFFHTPDEHYLRFLYGNFTRLLRMFSVFVAIFTTAIYVAITNYHSEMIPPDLLLAIAGTRERVPFPVIFEVMIMEVAFELIREAALRVPSAIGPTIGIVGALVLGQAAVEANIISPIVIIVVAVGGLASYAISDINLNFSLRIIRFLFILSASMFGMYGMTALFVVGIVYINSLKSFGVPYLAPFTPHYLSSGDTMFRKALNNEVFRPGFLKPKDTKKMEEGS